MSISLDEELNSVFVAPSRQFKGEELATYSEGSRLLMMQVRGESDSPMFFVWAFLYLHIQIKKNRKEAIRLAWDKDSFREKIMEWADTMSELDRDNATSMVGQILEEAGKGQVTPLSVGPPGKA
jgi:hypothetical protein